jgi:hypothetical protein
VVLQGYVDNNLRIAVRGSGYNDGARGGLLASTGDFSSNVTVIGNLNLQGAVTRNINFYDSSNTNINAQIQYDQISSTSGQLFFGTNNAGTFATRLTISNTGAATFSSSVTATILTVGTNGGSSVNITTNGNNGTSASPLQTNLNFYGFNSNLNGQIRVDDIAGTAQIGTMKFYTWNSAQVLALTLAQTGAATFSSSVGVAGAAATYPITVYNASNGTTAAFGGTARGIRIDNDGTFSSGRSTIFGVDSSFYGSYQPLSIEASSLALQVITGGNVLIGTTTDNGNKLQVNGVAQASNFITDTGTASIITFSVGYSVFYTVPSNQNAIYLVTLQLNGFSEYTAYATICQNNNGLVIMNQVNNVAYIRVSGLNIEGSQNSGSTQSMRWRIIKIGQ